MHNSFPQLLNQQNNLIQVEQKGHAQDSQANHGQFKIWHLSHLFKKFWQIAKMARYFRQEKKEDK